MAFGPIMRLKVGELEIELAPLGREDMERFISPGMNQASVSNYLSRRTGNTLEDEYEWFEKTRKESDSIIWGIFDITDGKRIVIGTTGITGLTNEPLKQATSGVLIFDRDYWGKGIATHIHKARTWYLFRQVGLVRIKSAVIHGNVASLKALETSGYSVVYTERNTTFGDGKLRHQDNLECLNPSLEAWRQWWGSDRPTKRSVETRKRTLAALKWAEEHVSLP